MRIMTVVAGMLMLLTCPLRAQPRFGTGEQITQFVYCEAVVRPADGDSLRSHVDLHYRIDKEFFVSVKNPESTSPFPFHRRGELLCELVDSTGTTAARALDRIELGDETGDRKLPGRDWHQGVFSFSVRKGSYKIHLSLDDLESRRNFVDKTRSVRVPDPTKVGLEYATTMIITPAAVESSLPASLSLMNYGGEVLFGKPSMLAVVWVPSAREDSVLTVTYTFAQLSPSSEDTLFLPTGRELKGRIHRNVAISPSSDGNSVTYTVGHGNTIRSSLAIFPFPSDKLLLRTYSGKTSLSSGVGHAELTKTFRTVWPDMPFSLKDIDYALEVLKYITTESELDSLRSGNIENRRKNLEGFWRRKDSTPETAFNEVQTEYYRRVDHAMKTFGTLRQPDGFRSDRGRIYILYGPPTKTERSLDPAAGYKELWIYGRLNKTFTFVDQTKSGNYILMTSAQ